MRIYLAIISFFVLILPGCNDTTKSVSGIVEETDSISTSLNNLATVTDIKKLLCQNWEHKEDAEDALLSGGSDGLEMLYRGFSFFEDATLVENPRDKIRFGKWSMNDADKMIDIVFDNGSKSQYKIVAIGAKQMILMNTSDKKKTEYRADAIAQKNYADDPFYESNNQWRIKPAHAESDSAIKLRTEQCVFFYAKFLSDNVDRGGNIISFAGLPTCFKWYKGGISIKAKDKLENKWLNCYYNKEQALKGYALLDGIISKKYKWNKEETNWVKQSAAVVRQMYDTLKSL